MNLITTLDAIKANIAALETYRNSPDSADYSTYQNLIKKGTCFFPYMVDRQVCFAPSRFIGYECNDLHLHTENRTRDGRETNETINRILISSPLPSDELESLYRDFCRSLSIEPNLSGNFGAPRRFWLTEEVEAALEQRTVDQLNQDVSLPAATRTAIIQARVGQGIFRDKLLKRWSSCCVSGCDVIRILRASHIKPWRVSETDEKLDEFNGLLLTANLDALFDEGLISFTNGGAMLISRQLNHKSVTMLVCEHRSVKVEFAPAHFPYLAYHREHVFKGPARNF